MKTKKDRIKTKKPDKDFVSTETLETDIELELKLKLNAQIIDKPYKLIGGATCPQCKQRFPKSLFLSEKDTECPECGTKTI